MTRPEARPPRLKVAVVGSLHDPTWNGYYETVARFDFYDEIEIVNPWYSVNSTPIDLSAKRVRYIGDVGTDDALQVKALDNIGAADLVYAYWEDHIGAHTRAELRHAVEQERLIMTNQELPLEDEFSGFMEVRPPDVAARWLIEHYMANY